ncbi:cytochrome P450 4c3-like [Tropilaelaps mercedesae]|uniref:Cytochrome P450 4c3-like n=1 Tax=Tropilaelaps mercedesae TaxID=418985 RepID=A0A1V9XEP1_9ACAR|nr:cytochrome P450 4c3-like [Tropilaelaps mercedesae]
MEWWHLGMTLMVAFIVEYVRRYGRRNALLKARGAPPGPPVPTNFINPFAYELHLLKTRFTKNFTNMGEVLLNEMLLEAAKHPEGVFRFFLSFTPVTVLTRAEAVKSLLGSNTLLTKASFYKLIEPWLGTGLLTSTNGKWKSRRKMLTPSFHFDILKEFATVFSEQSEIMTSLIENKVGQKVDIMKYLKNSTLDIICETAMGVKINAQTHNSDYHKAQTVVGMKFMKRCLSPWQWPAWLYRTTMDGRTFFKNLRTVHSFTMKVIEERMHEHVTKMARGEDPLSGKQRKAFLDLLISEQLKNKSMELEDIREEVDTFMFEGHDTTAVGTGWALFLLGHNPDVQTKLHEEIDMVFGSDRERLITIDDVKQMKYLEAVIKVICKT